MIATNETNAGVSTMSAEQWAWQERVDNSIDFDDGGTIFVWLRRLANGESSLKLTPEQADELALALKFAAGAARKGIEAKEPDHG